MHLPSGLIFYLYFKYGTIQTANLTDGADVYGNTSGSNVDASGGLYGAGKFGYSINDKETADLDIHASNIDDNEYGSGSVTWEDVDFEPDLSASVALGNAAATGLMKITTSTLAYTNADVDGVRAFSISGSGFDEFFPAYTKHDKAN